MNPFCDIYNVQLRSNDLALLIDSHLPDGNFKSIFIKPNWVYHQEHQAFPIDAIATNSSLIDLVIEACVKKYKSAQEIIIGDVPLQSCDWELLLAQSGMGKLIKKYEAFQNPLIKFLDLRKERVRMVNGFMELYPNSVNGDPKGYKEVVLEDTSFLEAISTEKTRFKVSDYNPEVTASNQHKGFHSYLICGSVLDCDLFINIPKMKTHRMAGITGALKNVVGINSQKANLVHFRAGGESRNGDEFPPGVHPLIVFQTRIRDMLQKKHGLLYRLLRRIWILVRRLACIKVEATAENLDAGFYTAPGAWYGNDTIWRMIYDLNEILLYAPREGGKLRETPQRHYIAIMDGLVAGEGNGPTQPLPLNLGVIILSNDPFLMDMVTAQMMGFDYNKIPMLSNFKLFGNKLWGFFDPMNVGISLNGEKVLGISPIPSVHRFIPPPGWRGHIELSHITPM